MSRGAGSEEWREHFRRRHADRAESGQAESLDYSNERVRIQTYACLLEGAGEVAGRTALDAGCGWGSLALTLHGCGARVTAVDLVEETIDELAGRYPFVDWRALDLADADSVGRLPRCDLVIAAEVLQYLELEGAVGALWGRVAAGGRLVAAVPNADCPIARRVAAADRRWKPASEARLRALARGLPEVDGLWLAGLTFRDDQSFQPYRASGWGGELAGVPNRIAFALERAAPAG